MPHHSLAELSFPTYEADQLPPELQGTEASQARQLGTHRPTRMFKFDTTLNRLRSVGILEAISFLLLLGIAMPLKYAFGQPEMVRIVGMAHGVLWILYVGTSWGSDSSTTSGHLKRQCCY